MRINHTGLRKLRQHVKLFELASIRLKVWRCRDDVRPEPARGIGPPPPSRLNKVATYRYTQTAAPSPPPAPRPASRAAAWLAFVSAPPITVVDNDCRSDRSR